MIKRHLRRWALGLTVVFIIFLSRCSLNETTEPESTNSSLKRVGTYELSVPEPSGLALHPDGKSLWTVSDRTNQVYQISLTGQVLRTLKYTGTDLEGIAYDARENCLWVAEEQTRELVKLDSAGNELERHRLLSGADNSGIEGICLDSGHHFFALKEKNPGLFLVLDSQFQVTRQISLNFAGDYSGLWADTSAGRFWIVSDQDQALFLWDINQGVLQEFSLPITKAEGVAIDFTNDRFYLVSDSESRLYVLTRP